MAERSPLGPAPASPLQIDPARQLLETPGAGAAAALMAGQTATLPKRFTESSERLRTTGQYDPAPAFELMQDMLMLGPLAAERGALGAAGGKGLPPITQMAKVPDIRGMPVDAAIKIARKEPHLIPKAGGGFVGGPPSIQTRSDLMKLRRAFDKYIAKNPGGGDWYDRYRAAIAEVTGNNPLDNEWFASQLGQWSAGVAPEIEAQFALKESNAAIAGMPVKASRPAQHEAHMRAIAAQDPGEYMLGEKTGEYAGYINPDRPGPPGATGVNDFRYARQWGYPTVSGQTNAGGVGVGQGAPHRWLDYETALAVGRANKKGLGGRSDWTGEQLQAVPWIRQKGEAIQARSAKDPAKRISDAEGYERANTTLGDYLGKHTAYATHEAHPGAQTGHLPGSVGATQVEREEFAADPRSHWMDPSGRDAIYSDMRVPGTGVAMRVRPSTEMQGVYRTPAGVVETNPGWSASPLTAFDAGRGGTKTTAAADQMLLGAGEATRGYIDAQNAAAWHQPWRGGPANNSFFIPLPRKLTTAEVLELQKEMAPYGLSDIADTGRGVTITRFWPPPDEMSWQKASKAGEKAKSIIGPDAKTAERVAVSGGLVDYATPPEGRNIAPWQEGGGAVTRQLLEHVNKTPAIRTALNNNKFIPQKALDRLERDEQWAAKWNAPREDIQNARRIIGAGTGWIDRLEEALKTGAVSLPAVAAVLGTAALYHREEQQDRGQQ